MTSRVKPFRKESVVEILLLRDKLGLQKYRKTLSRDPEERQILLELALEKIKKAELNNFKLIGNHKRRFRA
jgi:hypothetical protein